jgi:ABC-type polysaccharide/polyol phosphate transport system ATPase subunit
MVRQLCDQALWLHHGQAMMVGSPEDVLNAYSARRAEG